MSAITPDEAAQAIATAIHDAECQAYIHEGRNARCERSARAVVQSEWFAAERAKTAALVEAVRKVVNELWPEDEEELLPEPLRRHTHRAAFARVLAEHGAQEQAGGGS